MSVFVYPSSRRMVSFTPPAPKLATVQKFGRQAARGPTPLTLLALVLVAILAVPLIRREGWYQQDAKKGAPWDRILAEREKLAAKAQ